MTQTEEAKVPDHRRKSRYLLRPGHLEGAMIILALIGGKEIRWANCPVVMVNAAGQRTQIRIAMKSETLIRPFHCHIRVVAESENLAVGGAIAGFILRVVQPG